ncbi:cell division protein ZapB [Candidatus Dependentiae bacterium]|nr:cell division protein ZapB [Candidatus Dependentiae bacterium]
MEAASVKNKQAQAAKSDPNLIILEQKIFGMIEMIKGLKSENVSLKEKNKELQGQIRVLESSLVAETKDLEELSQEKIMAKMVVDNLLHSIDSLIEVKEK